MSSAATTINRGKVLIVLSGADFVRTEKGDQETGFFLPELAKPLMKLLENGYEVVFANPTGQPPHMDPMSDNALWFFGNWREKNREKELIERMKLEKNFMSPRPLSSFTEEELETFDGIFVPGGHAPMTDLWKDPDLGRILLHFHNRSKPTGMICHGPISLLSVKQVLKDKPWPYAGYNITLYSDKEEKLNDMMWGKINFKAESALKEAGANTVEAFLPMGKQVTVDRELITAQNPTSAGSFAETFVNALNERIANRLGATA
eukprot:GEZU01040749.1.p1 GENE.GEZU01040749.1~~GEZU01040749.1.p1  ORF type:complete len:262 (+),score=91.42 GEZU01040749.1:57-842(+)